MAWVFAAALLFYQELLTLLDWISCLQSRSGGSLTLFASSFSIDNVTKTYNFIQTKGAKQLSHAKQSAN